MSFSLLAQFALWGSFALSVEAASGSGTSTRYWDCCKPSCAWPQKANVNQPVYTCDASDRFLSDFNTKSGCDSGTAYTCTNQAPWALNSLVSYGFAATAISGETEADWCCGCYAVTFTSGKAKGKVMLLQSTNTGSDLANNHFDLQIPGGGLGIFDGCTSQFGGIPGSRYGGISSRSDCAAMPAALQAGCYWRFDWFNNADNPTHTFTQIQCPAELVNRTGCRRADDASFPVYTMPSATTWNPPVPTETAAAYSQCDSLTWDVAKMCPVGYTCSYVTDYYWQCVQGSSPSSTKTSSAVTSSKPVTDIISSSSRPATTSSSTKTTTSTTASSPTATGSVPAWGQCNAVTWPTPAKCQDGLKCVYINDFYSQCQP